MREMEFAPTCGLNDEEWKNKDLYYKKRTELLSKTNHFVKTFEKTYHFECKVLPVNNHYTDDGWDYGKDNFYDAEEWIFPVGSGKKTHFYYNELDHYLSYLIGKTRREKGSNDCSRECGLKVLKSEIEYLYENRIDA